MSNQFWGPNVNACIDWAKAKGILHPAASPMQFYDTMCNATQVWPGPMQNPEVCAAEWLREIKNI